MPGAEISRRRFPASAIFRPAAKHLAMLCCRPVSLLSVLKIRQGESSRVVRAAKGPARRPYFLLFFLVDFFAVFFLAVFLAAAIIWLLRVWRLLVRPLQLPGRRGRDAAVCRKLDK